MRKLLLRLSAAGYVAAIAALVSVAVVDRGANVLRSVEHNIPSALSKKLARSARFAPADARRSAPANGCRTGRRTA